MGCVEDATDITASGHIRHDSRTVGVVGVQAQDARAQPCKRAAGGGANAMSGPKQRLAASGLDESPQDLVSRRVHHGVRLT